MYKSKYQVELSEFVKISVIEWSEEDWEIGILWRSSKYNDWKLDYSEFDDVIRVQSHMQVYGMVEYEIKPKYEKWLWGNKGYIFE